jgi:hypothetical protein
MNSDTTFLLMAIAVAVSSLALVTHALASVGLYRAVRRLEERVEPLIPQTLSTLRHVEETMGITVSNVREISDRAKAVLDATNNQLQQFDVARQDITDRVRIQAERVDLVLEDMLSRLQEVVHIFHSGVMRPVREVHGVMAGLKAAMQTLAQGRRPSVAQARNDEEMFI